MYICSSRKKNKRTTNSQYAPNDNHHKPIGVCVHAYVCNNNCSMLQIDSDYISITVQPPYREKEKKMRGREIRTRERERKRASIHSFSSCIVSIYIRKREEKVKIQTIVQCIIILIIVIIIIVIIVVLQQQNCNIMRHLFKRWASNNQLMTTSNSNSPNSLSTPIYHQRVPIIEEEGFDDDDDEGSFD